MDFSDLFSEINTPTEHFDAIPTEMDLTPEQEFISFLDADDNMEDFGLSILENNHDLIDVMTPLFATPFSPVPCDNLDFIDSGLQQMHQQMSETETSSEISPLKQLLLGQSRTVAPNTNAMSEEVNRSPPRKPPSARRQSSRNSKSLNSPTENSRSLKKTPNTKYSSESGDTYSYSYVNEQTKVKKEKIHAKDKATSKALKFPPCYICGGLASGLHYGVNSCEACKGFFRRYIIRNEEYKCTKGGNCKVVNKNRENCSGCRLKKCLELGMSKENCKLGRYSLSRRTETIKKVNVLEGKEKHARNEHKAPDSYKFDHTYSGLENRTYLSSLHEIVSDDCSPSSVIDQLVRAMDNIKPYGPNITTKKQILSVINSHHERYQNQVKTYGQMKAVSKDEYYKLFKEFGIDVDGRINCLREYIIKLKRLTERYFNFARQIPGFSKLESRDQSKLLNAFRCDFFIILMNEGYNKEQRVLLARNGVAYHIEELADKFFSGTLINGVCEAYFRFQQLDLNKEEKSLLMALSLTFTDRCNLSNSKFVDNMQYVVTEVLRYYLERMFGPKAHHRFAKFIECLIFLRGVSELYISELKQISKDELMAREIPMLTEFISEDCD